MGTVMTKTISKSQFKERALELFREIETTGEPVIITGHAQPRLEVRPCRAAVATGLKALRGSVLRYDDPCSPLSRASGRSRNSEPIDPFNSLVSSIKIPRTGSLWRRLGNTAPGWWLRTGA
jgi:antitoxin (DNA-binding transcriptional repressor) of toxin-antitoxin stability system